MRILQINSVCGIGSTGRIATDIHQLLEAEGHESYIAYGREDAMNCTNAKKIGGKLDFYSHVLISRLFDKHGYGSKKATKNFIKYIDDLKPDLIHLHNIHGYYINIKILFNYLKTQKIPVLWTLHDCWAFTGHCAYYDLVGCNKWESKCINCPQKKEYPQSILLDNSEVNYYQKMELFTQLDNLTLVTPSEWLKNEVNRSFLKKIPTTKILNGINLSIFKPVASNIKKRHNIEDKIILLSVANVWEKRKGLYDLIELNKQLDPTKFTQIIIGLDNKQIDRLPKNIIGISRTTNINELVEYYSAADIFINTTYEETLGLVNIESIACNTPVITYNSGGAPECVSQNSGIVVETSNIEGVKKAILEILNNRYKYTDCIKYSKEFSKEKMLYSYLNEYKKILGYNHQQGVF